MSPAELRREMRERKRELRATLPAMRKAARARADQLPAVRKARTRRRVRRAVGLTIVALLLLLMRCDCGPTPPPEAATREVEKTEPEPKPKKKVVVRPAKLKPLEGQGKHQPRGSLAVAGTAPATWIDEFQLQVAARSPRLAACFTGIERPGALRWAAAVNPQSGAVSDHELEPVGASDELDQGQRSCVVKVLSSPNYRLTAPEKEVLPNRVSLVIEF